MPNDIPRRRPIARAPKPATEIDDAATLTDADARDAVTRWRTSVKGIGGALLDSDADPV